MRSEKEIRERLEMLTALAIKELREVAKYINECLHEEKQLPSITVCTQSLFLVVRYLEIINTLLWVLGEKPR